MKAVLIPTDFTVPMEEVELEKVANLGYYNALREAIGGYSAAVVISNYKTLEVWPCMGYVDEDGYAKRLPMNVRACVLVGCVPDGVRPSPPPVVGPMVVTGWDFSIGDWAELPLGYKLDDIQKYVEEVATNLP